VTPSQNTAFTFSVKNIHKRYIKSLFQSPGTVCDACSYAQTTRSDGHTHTCTCLNSCDNKHATKKAGKNKLDCALPSRSLLFNTSWFTFYAIPHFEGREGFVPHPYTLMSMKAEIIIISIIIRQHVLYYSYQIHIV